MVLFLTSENVIYAKNEKMKKEEIAGIADAVWYDGEFSFFDGEEREGFYKIFKWDGKEPVVEYEPITELPYTELTIDEKIYAAVSKSQDEIRQEGADMVMDELLKRGLIV